MLRPPGIFEDAGMRKLFIVASVVAGLAGCSKDKFDDMLGELEGFKNKMCECKDEACADKVQDDWRAYRKTMKEKIGKDSKPSEAQDKKGRDLTSQMRECRRNARKSGDAGGAAEKED